MTLEGPAGVAPPLLEEEPPAPPSAPEGEAPAPGTEPPALSPAPEAEPPKDSERELPKPRVRKREVEIFLNGKPIVLPPKENDQPYYVMDLLERSGVDFETLDGPVHLAVNGTECGFSHAVKDRDSITIR